MMRRLLQISYTKVNVVKLMRWLNANKYKFSMPFDDDETTQYFEKGLIGTLELYSEEAEVATRLTWEIE